jgi:multiple sugar transport system substrate-binding protein
MAAQLLTIDASGRNPTEAEFSPGTISQYGFTWQYEQHPNYWGSYWAGGSMVGDDGKTAQVPDGWREAWEWTYDGIWGEQPFIPKIAVELSKLFGKGNPFNSNRVAMTVQPVWYTCCMKDVGTWEAAAVPMYNGRVGGRVDADTFRVWKGTRNPLAAFHVLTYLTGEGARKLILGDESHPAAYGAVPARMEDQEAWVAAERIRYPWVKHWDVILDGLNYPDIPGADGYMPNFNNAWMRGNTFATLLRNTRGVNMDWAVRAYLRDLNAIFAR